jgi:outer membrane protein TolC
MHARSFILCLTLAAAPLAAQQAPDTAVARTIAPAAARITLADALTRAVQVQPSTVQARGAIRNADAQQRSAYGAFLPSLNATSSAGSSSFEGTDQFDGRSTNSLSMGLNASVDLWTGLRRGADIAAANATDRSAEAGLVNARFQIVQQTTSAYLDALANAQTVEVRAASVRRAQEQLKVSVAKLHAGSATRSDSLRSEVNMGNARVALINAEIAQATAEATLGRLVGAAGRVAAIDDTTYTAIAPIDTTGVRTEAQASAPQVLSAQAQADAAHAQVRSAYAAYSPTLTLSGNYGFNGSSPRFDTNPLYNQRSVSLGLNWPLFNRFQREQTVVIRSSSADLAEATASDAKRAVDAGITQWLAQLAATRTRIDITRSSVQAATEDLRVVGERYRLGAATIVDLLTSQEALTQAEIDAVNARFDYLRAKAQVEALIGRSL